MSKHLSVEIINLGDELLVGIRENTHLQYLGQQLAEYGLPVTRARVIADDLEAIKETFASAWSCADIVLTTGGLGPTADDLTREAIASALEVELVYDASIESVIRDRFAALGRTMAEHHRKQCYCFKNGLVLPNDQGTAPGLIYQTNGKMLIMLPGPTHELRPMFERQVLPLLQLEGHLSDEPAYLQLRTCGAGESTIEAKLQSLQETYLDLSIAYCVHYGIVDVRLSSREGTLKMSKLKKIGHAARQQLGEDFVCFGDCSLAAVVYRELRALDRTLAVAESCTGGLLGDAFTNVPGASKAFLGGVICYSNDVKVALLGVPDSLLEQHGAVSAECAIAMATGSAERLSADYGLSITGFAGPEGGNKDNPLGTIHIGYHSPVGVWCKTVRYTGGRLDVKARAVHAALDWMRRKIRKYKFEEFLNYSATD